MPELPLWVADWICAEKVFYLSPAQASWSPWPLLQTSNRPQLLAQVILPLRPVHFSPGLRGDLLLHRQNGDLFGQALVDVAEAVDRIGGLEHLLGFLELQIEVGGRQVRQARGIVEIGGDHHHFRRDVLPQGNGLLEVLLDAAQQSLVLRRQLFGNLFLFQSRDLGQFRRGRWNKSGYRQPDSPW